MPGRSNCTSTLCIWLWINNWTWHFKENSFRWYKSYHIIFHVIKLQKLGMRYGDRGAWADLANSFKKRNRNQTFKRAFEIETMNHWITGPGNASAVVMWKNSLKCDFGHFLSKVKEEFFNQRKSFDPTLREAVKKKLRKGGQADRLGWPPPPKRSGCCDFFKISWHILTYFTILYWEILDQNFCK